jgi:hypothetical protein
LPVASADGNTTAKARWREGRREEEKGSHGFARITRMNAKTGFTTDGSALLIAGDTRGARRELPVDSRQWLVLSRYLLVVEPGQEWLLLSAGQGGLALLWAMVGDLIPVPLCLRLHSQPQRRRDISGDPVHGNAWAFCSCGDGERLTLSRCLQLSRQIILTHFPRRRDARGGAQSRPCPRWRADLVGKVPKPSPWHPFRDQRGKGGGNPWRRMCTSSLPLSKP